MNSEESNDKVPSNSLSRGFAIVRLLADAPDEGLRLKEIALRAGLAQATVHRLLKSLEGENVVEQMSNSKNYRLSLDLYSLAARSGGGYSRFREQCRPSLLRLAGSLNDTVFLMVRTGFDVVCLDRIEGPLPIRSLTGDVGGRVPLGMGQAGAIILALVPQTEREEVIRFNVPRLLHLGYFDEISLRAAIEKAAENGYALSLGKGPLPEMGGVSVGIVDRQGVVIGALSVGALAERLNAERLPHIVQLLRAEADRISNIINPFDPALRRPTQYLGSFEPAGNKPT
ncbi:IclR family transcriptional regulator [Allopusillimonas ginsengisoli]|uniref:IclR family transcriptional regulator n=1 Tax=Allopusillimonas ginsengisoli TaxID=453575 RepID=UPI0039C20E8C